MSEKTLLSILVILVAVSVGLQIATLSQIAAISGGPMVRPSVSEKNITDAPLDVVLDIRGIPMEGDRSASAIIVEFTDYECPYCLRHANVILPQLRAKYTQNSKLRYAAANLPLWIHKSAEMLASAAVCSTQQGRFWDLHDLMFSKSPRTEAEVMVLAESLGIDAVQLQTCMEGPLAKATIQRESELAATVGIQSTPSFLLGTLQTDGRLAVKKLIVGAQPMSVFEQAIDALSEN